MSQKTTKEELDVLDKLKDAWNLFLALNRSRPGHPCDVGQFRDGIHKCQDVLAHRLACRVDPDVWSGGPS